MKKHIFAGSSPFHAGMRERRVFSWSEYKAMFPIEDRSDERWMINNAIRNEISKFLHVTKTFELDLYLVHAPVAKLIHAEPMLPGIIKLADDIHNQAAEDGRLKKMAISPDMPITIGIIVRGGSYQVEFVIHHLDNTDPSGTKHDILILHKTPQAEPAVQPAVTQKEDITMSQENKQDDFSLSNYVDDLDTDRTPMIATLGHLIDLIHVEPTYLKTLIDTLMTLPLEAYRDAINAAYEVMQEIRSADICALTAGGYNARMIVLDSKIITDIEGLKEPAVGLESPAMTAQLILIRQLPDLQQPGIELGAVDFICPTTIKTEDAIENAYGAFVYIVRKENNVYTLHKLEFIDLREKPVYETVYETEGDEVQPPVTDGPANDEQPARESSEAAQVFVDDGMRLEQITATSGMVRVTREDLDRLFGNPAMVEGEELRERLALAVKAATAQEDNYVYHLTRTRPKGLGGALTLMISRVTVPDGDAFQTVQHIILATAPKGTERDETIIDFQAADVAYSLQLETLLVDLKPVVLSLAQLRSFIGRYTDRKIAKDIFFAIKEMQDHFSQYDVIAHLYRLASVNSSWERGSLLVALVRQDKNSNAPEETVHTLLLETMVSAHNGREFISSLVGKKTGKMNTDLGMVDVVSPLPKMAHDHRAPKRRHRDGSGRHDWGGRTTPDSSKQTAFTDQHQQEGGRTALKPMGLRTRDWAVFVRNLEIIRPDDLSGVQAQEILSAFVRYAAVLAANIEVTLVMELFSDQQGETSSTKMSSWQTAHHKPTYQSSAIPTGGDWKYSTPVVSQVNCLGLHVLNSAGDVLSTMTFKL